MKRTLALALTIGVLLTGCNRAQPEAPPPPKTHSTTVTTPTTQAKAPDVQLEDVDGILNQVDSQLKADSQKAPDED